MAGQNVVFDFLTVGADRTASDFRRTGDNAALAAKGAKVLSDTIAQLGAKQDRTAGESKILASALRQTGDAADRMTAKTVLADAAIRRLDDAMQEASKKPLEPQVTTAKALKALAGIQVRADELKARFPEFTVQIDDKAAKAKLALFAAESKVTLDKIDRRLSGGGAWAGIAGLFGGAGAKQAGGAASAGSGLLGNPYVAGGAVAAGLAVAPFAGQLAAGGIVAAFGGALAGMAILGAAKAKSVEASFAHLKTAASADLTKIGTSFVPVMNSILGTARSVLGQMTPVFAGAAKTISGPFRTFGDTLIKAFGSPAAKQSIAAVAGAFGHLLTSVTPALGQGIAQVAQGITRVANSFAAMNPAVIRHFTAAMFDIVTAGLDVISALTRTANYIETHFGPAMHRTAVIFDGVRHDIAHIWDQIFSNSAGSVIRIGHNVLTQFNSMRHGIAVVFGGTRHDISAAWDTIWNNTTGRVIRGIGDVVRFVHAMPGRIVTTLGAAGSVLSGWGSGVIHGLLSGMTSIIGSVWTFIKGIPGKILSFLGIHSPPQWAIDAGKHIMNGIGIGMSQAQGKLAMGTQAFSSQALAGSVGGGVEQWRGLVLKALGMEGLSRTLADAVLYQMQTESGGRVNAINLTDINAQRGDPSRGLMQVIGSTFRAYHWPGTSGNIYDPLANIAAALNYARHNYGPGLRNAQGGIGTGHGYAAGTPGAAPGWGWVGERGPELVNFRGGEQVLPAARLGGYATGTAGAGAAYLKAWQTRHGGGYGAAWGPVNVNQQIAAMSAAVGRAKTLSGAPGMSAGQHRFWSAAAGDETRRLGVLHKELVTERAWRNMLGINELGLDKEIRAAGNLPSLAKNVRGWKAQLGRDKATVAAISKMLGYSDAYIKAHPAAKPGPVLPTVTHSYGGDVANNLGVVLAAALGPFTGAARGGMVSYDQGGWLKPGATMAWNGTNRPEMVVPASSGGGGRIVLEVTSGGNSEFEHFMTTAIRKWVKVKGGTGPGAVDRAFGNR